jgi:hypothetical protein
MEDKELEMLNPQIKEILVGTKTLKKVKIYPLSTADQLELTGNISSSILNIIVLKEESNFKIVSLIKDIVTDNIGKILTYVTDEGEPLMKEISNEQLLYLVEIIYDMNYGSLEKKTTEILKKIMKTFLPAGLSLVSSEPIPNTDLKTSSEEALEMEDLQ